MPTETATISIEGFEIVNHILTLGYASMAAALLFFVLTKNSALPKYRMSAVISVVVMTSAFLLLFIQKESWSSAFEFDGEAYVVKSGADLFTNGYRYLNWLIDVPMLLIQILFVAEIAGADRARYMTRFTISGALMILLGYVGQFYEPGRLNENITAWAIWGLVVDSFFHPCLDLDHPGHPARKKPHGGYTTKVVRRHTSSLLHLVVAVPDCLRGACADEIRRVVRADGRQSAGDLYDC